MDAGAWPWAREFAKNRTAGARAARPSLDRGEGGGGTCFCRRVYRGEEEKNDKTITAKTNPSLPLLTPAIDHGGCTGSKPALKNRPGPFFRHSELFWICL